MSGRVFLPDSLEQPTRVGYEEDGAIYKFWKVEDFFAGFDTVPDPSHVDQSRPYFDGMMAPYSPVTGPLKGVQVSPDDALTLEVTLTDTSLLLIELIRFDTFRIRWGPAKTKASQYSMRLSPSIVMDSLGELRARLQQDEDYKLTAVGQDLAQDHDDARFEWSVRRDGLETMKIIVRLADFSLEAWRNVGQNVAPGQTQGASKWACVWSTTSATDGSTVPPLLARKDPEGNYAVCFGVTKRGKSLGYGEQGGLSLFKEKQMLNNFNYDNMGYSAVYGQQAIDPREPMYHSDPFWVEVDGVAGYKSAVGTFVDDYSQILVDVATKHAAVQRVGSRFGDLEVHINCADDLAGACFAHASTVGRTKLFPRYILGYHQGCYGWDTRQKVIDAVEKHRRYGIPLDGAHIDVDLQDHYRTFTMDQSPNGKFKDAKGMFTHLKSLGVKCSTNITPVIASVDNDKRNYWENGSQARQQYRTLDEGLKLNVFVKDHRWNAPSNPPVYSYWEGGQEHKWAPASIDNYNDGASAFRGGVSYGENLGTDGVYPDFGRKAVRDWWGRQYKDLLDAGLEMVWQDMTTPCIRTGAGDMKSFPFRLLLSDDSTSGRQQEGILSAAVKIQNLYSYNLHKATYHGLQRQSSRRDLRNFIVGRGSFTGAHRFAALWTGDTTSSWDFLRIMLQQVLSCGIGGTILAGADVGGFERFPWTSQWADPQLLIRWTLANSLLPWFRNHYMGKPGAKLFQEPYGYYEYAANMGDQAPLYRAVLPICRYFITLRYTLMQLLYDQLFGSLFDGKPIARSMLATDPWDLSLCNDHQNFLSEQFVIGNDLFVAPVVHSQQELATFAESDFDVYLPRSSRYFDFNLHLLSSGDLGPLTSNWAPLSDARPGGQVFEYITSIDRYVLGDVGHLPYLLPTFVREGAIIPTIQIESYVRQLRPNPITLHCYPISDGRPKTSYDMYLDDGISRASAPSHLPQFDLNSESEAKSDYRHIRVEQQRTGDVRTITLTLVHSKYDLQRTKADIGDKLTLYVWHEVDEAERAQKGLSIGVAKGAPPSPSTDDSARWDFDATINATIISVDVDDVDVRQVTVTLP